MKKLAVVAMAVACVALCGTAGAVTYYWDTDGTTPGFGTASGTWGTNNFWNTDSTGGAGGVFVTNTGLANGGDTVNFGTASAGLGTGTITVFGSQGFNGMTFGSASGAITISGGTLGIGMGGPTTTITVNNLSNTISSSLSADASLTKSGTGTLILSGTNYFTGATTISAGTLQLDNALAAQYSTVTVSSANGLKFGTSIGTFTIGGLSGAQTFALTDTAPVAITLQVGNNNTNTTYTGAMSGTGGNLVKIGTGTLTLQGANTYTGATTIHGGTLTLSGASGTLANTSGVTVNSGSTLNLDFGTGRNVINDSAGLTLGGGTVTLTAGSTTEEVASATLNAGAASVTRTASSVLRMNAITRNAGGTINFGAASVADTDTSNDAAGILGGWATVGGGNWAVSSGAAANTAITALGTYVNDTWAAGNNTTVTSNSSPAAASTTHSLRFNNAGAFTVSLSGANTINSGGILNTSTVGANTSQINGGTLTSGVSDLIVHQYNTNPLQIGSVITGGIGLTKSGTGAGVVTLSGANDYTGTTTLSAGTVNAGVAENVGVSGPFGNPTTPAGSIVFAGGTLQYSASNTFDYSSRFTTSGNANYSINTNGQPVTLASALAANSLSGLTKSGTGTLTLSGGSANTFTGITTVSGGQLTLNKTAGVNAIGGDLTIRSGATVLLSAANQIPDTASVGFPDGGTWNLNNNNETINALVGGVNVGQVDLGSATLTLGYDNGNGYSLGNGPSYFSGVITGSGGLIKNGTNYQRLDRTSSFTGTVIINNGILGASQANALGGSGVGSGTTVNSGGTLGLDNNAGGNDPLILNGLGFANGGALRGINGSQNYSGPITLGSSGVLIYQRNGTLTLNGTATITGSNTDLIFDGDAGTTSSITALGAIALGSGSLTWKGASGILTLQGANSYTGLTSITSTGTIVANNASALGTSASGTTVASGGTLDVRANIGTEAITVVGAGVSSGGALISGGTGTVGGTVTMTGNTNMGGTGTLNINGVISDGGSGYALTKVGSGTLVLAGANTYTGINTISAGTVTLGSAETPSTSGPLGNSAASNPGNIVLSGGTLRHSLANQFDYSGRFSTAASQQYRVDTNAQNVTWGTNLTSSGGLLAKSGAGTLTLTGANSYAGTTTVSGGILRVDGSLAAGSAVTVSGGAIGGTGTVNGTVTVSSTGGVDLRSGGVSTLTLGSTLNITGAAGANNLSFDLGNGTGTSDLLAVPGTTTVTNTGAAVINLNQLGGTAGRMATTYTLIGGAGTLDATNFAKFSLATTAAFGQTYSLANGGTNGDLQLVATNVTSTTPAAFWKGGTNNWSTAANWNTDATSNIAVGAAPDYLTNVTFSTTTPVPTNTTTNVVDVDFDINSLNFNAAAGGVTIGAAATPKLLTIEATNANGNTAGIGINSANTSGTNTINTKVGLAASQTWTVASGGTLTVNGVISDFGAGNSLTKAGAGTVRLTNVSNEYSGATVINEGKLNVHTTAGGQTINTGLTSIIGKGNLVFGGGTLLFTNSGGNGSIDTDRPFTIGNANGLTATIEQNNSGDSGRYVRFNGTGPIAFGGSGARTLTLTGTHQHVNEITDFFSPIVGDGPGGSTSLIKSGSGSWDIRGANTYTGSTTINQGILGVGSLANGGTTSSIGASSSAAANLVLGGGTLRYYGDTTSIDRSFTLTNSTTSIMDIGTRADSSTDASISLTISGAAANTTGALTKAGPGTLVLAGANQYTGLTTVNSGTLKLSPTGTIASGNALTLTSGTFDVNGQQAQTLGTVTHNNATITNTGAAATLTIGNNSSGNGGWTGPLSVIWNNGANSNTLSGAWTNTGNITVNANGGGQAILSGSITSNGNVILNNNTASADRVVLSGTVNPSGTITNSGTGTQSSLISGTIGANVTGVIQNSATSQLTLSGTNTSFNSGLTIKRGTVSGTTSANAFGANTNVITIGDSSGSANATLNGGFAGTHTNPISIASGNTGTATITSSAASIFSGPVTLNSHDLRLAPAGSTLTLSGGMTGTGNLTIATTGGGATTLSTNSVNISGTITNAGTGSGLTTISGGIGSNVTAVTQDSTGSSAMTISTNALTVNSGGTTLTKGTAGGAGLLTVSGGIAGTGNLILNNNSITANGITLSTTAVNHTGSITNSGTGTGGVTISAPIGSNVTSVTQNSAYSTLTLSNASNSYTGGTTVSSGTLKVTGDSLPSGGALSVSGAGTVLDIADGTARTHTVGALTLSSGALLKPDWTTTPSADLITTGSTATTSGTVYLSPTGTFTSGNTYTLISAAGGLSGASYLLANNINYTGTVVVSPTTVQLTPTTATALTAAYWKGGQVTGATSTMAASTGAVSNWASAVGGTATALVPGSGADVFFSVTGGPGSFSNPVLGADMNVRTVTFSPGTGAVTIGAGNTLTITPSSATTGITASENATINPNVALGAAQTWNVASGKTLTVGGTVSGANNLSKTGTGTLVLSGANTYTGTTTIGTPTWTSGGLMQFIGGATSTLGGLTMDGNGSSLTIDNGTTVNFTSMNLNNNTNNSLVNVTVNNGSRLNVTGGGTNQFGRDSNTTMAAINLDATSQINMTGTLRINGGPSGSGPTATYALKNPSTLATDTFPTVARYDLPLNGSAGNGFFSLTGSLLLADGTLGPSTLSPVGVRVASTVPRTTTMAGGITMSARGATGAGGEFSTLELDNVDMTWNGQIQVAIGDASRAMVILKNNARLATNSGMNLRNWWRGLGDIRGDGTVSIAGQLNTAGRVIADGGTLNLSYGSIVQYTAGGATINMNTSVGNGKAGWYAINGGQLNLPAHSVSGNMAWGDPDATTSVNAAQDMINSVYFTWTNRNGLSSLTGSVLASDNTSVPAGLYKPLGIWDFTGNVSSFDVNMRFRYDADRGSAISFTENNLKVYHYVGGSWQLVPSTLDVGNDAITGLNVTSFSQFAVAQALTPSAAYWTGDLGSLWSTESAANTNWATSATGATDTEAPPGSVSDVFFAASNASVPTLTNTLGADFSIKSLNFMGASPAASNTVTIGGANTLTIGTGGVTVQSGSANHVINTNTALGASQIWTVTDASNTLTVGGIVSGTAANSLTKAGSGTLLLTNNNTYSGNTIVSAGTLSVTATGSLANNNFDKVFIAADADNDFGTGIVPTLSRTMTSGTFAGYGSTEIGGLGDAATILASDTVPGSTTLAMQWRGRNNLVVPNETTDLASDIIRLTGMDSITNPGMDYFVLQMTYDDFDNDGFADANGANEADLVIAWLDGLAWENAINGNHGANVGLQYSLGWVAAGSPIALGSYGVDTVANVVWAVLDHNSDFSVMEAQEDVAAVPEPSSYVLGLLGLTGLGVLVWRKRKSLET